MKIAAREGPPEGFGGGLVSLLEAEQALLDGGEIREVIWRDDLSLDDAEVGFDLVESTGVNGCVDETRFGHLALSLAIAGLPRWEEPLSTIQKTRRAER